MSLTYDYFGFTRMEPFFRLLLAIIKAKLNLKISLQTMSQVFAFGIFEKTQLNQLFDRTDLNKFTHEFSNQLILFE